MLGIIAALNGGDVPLLRLERCPYESLVPGSDRFYGQKVPTNEQFHRKAGGSNPEPSHRRCVRAYRIKR